VAGSCVHGNEASGSIKDGDFPERSGWSVVRSASLANGGTSKKRPSPHLH
jgi:hypothetical protein